MRGSIRARWLPPSCLALVALQAAAQTPAVEILTASRSASALASTTISGTSPDTDSDTDSCSAGLEPGAPAACELGVDSAIFAVGSSSVDAGWQLSIQQGLTAASASASGAAHSQLSVEDLPASLSSALANGSSEFDMTLVVHEPGFWSIDLGLEANLLELDDPAGLGFTAVEASLLVRKNGASIAFDTVSDVDPSPSVSSSTSFARVDEPVAAGDVFRISVSAVSQLQGYEHASVEGVGSWSLAIAAPEPAPAHTIAVALGALVALAARQRATRSA